MQVVVVGGVKSRELSVVYGVPKSFVLAPLRILLLVNGLA